MDRTLVLGLLSVFGGFLVLIPIVLFIFSLQNRKQISQYPTPTIIPSPTAYKRNTVLPTQNQGFVLPQNSDIKYTGPLISNPASVPIYSENGEHMTQAQASSIARQLNFTGSPTQFKNGQGNTVLEWKNQNYDLMIELEVNTVSLNKLLNAQGSPNQSLTNQQVLSVLSPIISAIENKPITLNDSNTNIRNNPDYPDVISIQIFQQTDGVPVIASSTQFKNIVHFNKQSNLIEQLQYQVSFSNSSIGGKSLKNFSTVITPDNITKGTIVSITQNESSPSPTGIFTLKKANFTSAYLAYIVDRSSLNKTYVPAYIFEGTGEVKELPNQTFTILYMINAAQN